MSGKLRLSAGDDLNAGDVGEVFYFNEALEVVFQDQIVLFCYFKQL